MDITNLPTIAGSISTALFIASNVPMLYKAVSTRDLKSYSPGQILLSNLGNAIHWAYVLSLPVGPIWILHGFFTVTTAAMLGCYLRFEYRARRASQSATSTISSTSTA